MEESQQFTWRWFRKKLSISVINFFFSKSVILQILFCLLFGTRDQNLSYIRHLLSLTELQPQALFHFLRILFLFLLLDSVWVLAGLELDI